MELSICIWTWKFQSWPHSDFNAKNAAWSSRTLICSFCSVSVHLPLVSRVPLTAPQTRLDASNWMLLGQQWRVIFDHDVVQVAMHQRDIGIDRLHLVQECRKHGWKVWVSFFFFGYVYVWLFLCTMLSHFTWRGERSQHQLCCGFC